MKTIQSTFAVILLLGCTTACSDPASSTFAARSRGGGAGGGASSDPSGNGGQPTGSLDGNGGGGKGGGGTTTPEDNCSDAARLVYVVSEENTLYSFAPADLIFSRIGTLSCEATSTPFSMAVDRSGTAWVLYANGTLWKVSTKDASCTATSWNPRSASFHKFGMGFSSDAAGSNAETLYVSDYLGTGLGTIDLAKMTLTPIGAFDGALAGRGSELTGTGDGKLYGFFTTTPAQVAQITKGSGSIGATKPLDGVATGNAWAFSFWGGDFWLYTADASKAGGSNVTRYRPSDGSVTVVKQAIGFDIVGAGVSTCAPLVPPPPK